MCYKTLAAVTEMASINHPSAMPTRRSVEPFFLSVEADYESHLAGRKP